MISYPARSYPFAHPASMAALVHLHGVTPVSLERASVLDIGCAGGGQLIPLAARYPTANFVGLETKERDVVEARAWAKRHDLSNVTIHHCAAQDWQTDQRFDYIICHGILSWVSESVRWGIVATVERLLSARGVALMSHAVPFGSSAKQVVRALFLAVGESNTPTLQRVSLGRRALRELVLSFGTETSGFIEGIKEEEARLKNLPDEVVAHDILVDSFFPVALASLNARTSLNFVCDVHLGTDRPLGLSAHVQALVASQSSPAEKSNIIDLCKGRSFRRGLWTKQVPAEINRSALQASYVRGVIRIQPGWSLDEGKPSTFIAQSGQEIGLHSALSKGVVTMIAANPELPVQRLVDQFGPEALSFVLELLVLNAVTVADRALCEGAVDPFVPRELPSTAQITNAFLENISLSRFEIALLEGWYSDGNLYDHLVSAARDGSYELHVDGALCLDPVELRSVLEQVVPKRLAALQLKGLVGKASPRISATV